jgi:hypothetical protein
MQVRGDWQSLFCAQGVGTHCVPLQMSPAPQVVAQPVAPPVVVLDPPPASGALADGQPTKSRPASSAAVMVVFIYWQTAAVPPSATTQTTLQHRVLYVQAAPEGLQSHELLVQLPWQQSESKAHGFPANSQHRSPAQPWPAQQSELRLQKRPRFEQQPPSSQLMSEPQSVALTQGNPGAPAQ